MKVLLVITHGNIGGATNVVVDLARGLKARRRPRLRGVRRRENISPKNWRRAISRRSISKI